MDMESGVKSEISDGRPCRNCETLRAKNEWLVRLLMEVAPGKPTQETLDIVAAGLAETVGAMAEPLNARPLSEFIAEVRAKGAFLDAFDAEAERVDQLTTQGEK